MGAFFGVLGGGDFWGFRLWGFSGFWGCGGWGIYLECGFLRLFGVGGGEFLGFWGEGRKLGLTFFNKCAIMEVYMLQCGDVSKILLHSVRDVLCERRVRMMARKRIWKFEVELEYGMDEVFERAISSNELIDIYYSINGRKYKISECKVTRSDFGYEINGWINYMPAKLSCWRRGVGQLQYESLSV